MAGKAAQVGRCKLVRQGPGSNPESNSGRHQFEQFFEGVLRVNGHRRPAGIDVDLGCTILNGEVGNMPGEYNVGGPGNILHNDEVFHKFFWLRNKAGWCVIVITHARYGRREFFQPGV